MSYRVFGESCEALSSSVVSAFPANESAASAVHRGASSIDDRVHDERALVIFLERPPN